MGTFIKYILKQREEMTQNDCDYLASPRQTGVAA